MDPKVHVFLVCYNEEAILASTVRHYRRCFRDCKITIFDTMSDDSSRAIATAAGCSIVPWDSPHQGQLDEDTLTQVKNHLWKSHVEDGTWVVMADMDEWLCCSLAQLAEEEGYGTTILSTQGWQMVGESLRQDLTDIDLDEVCKGFRTRTTLRDCVSDGPTWTQGFTMDATGACRPGGSWRATDSTPSSTWRP